MRIINTVGTSLIILKNFCDFRRRSAAKSPDHLLDMSDRRVRQNAVTEIENKRAVRERRKDRVNTSVERHATRAQRQWVKIALHRTLLLNDVAGEIEIHHPIKSNRID